MKKLLAFLAAAGAVTSVAQAGGVGPAAAPPDWFVKAGVSGIFFEPGLSNVTLTPGPYLGGGAANIDNNVTGSFEVGRFISRNFALTLEGGIPPSTTFRGAGTFAGLGTVATATYGFVSAGVEWHPIRDAMFDPYLDAGGTYNILFSYTPGSPAITNLSIPNSFGGYIGAGVGMKLQGNWGTYVSVKQFFLSTDISATIPGEALTASAQFNPFVVSAGVSYSF